MSEANQSSREIFKCLAESLRCLESPEFDQPKTSVIEELSALVTQLQGLIQQDSLNAWALIGASTSFDTPELWFDREFKHLAKCAIGADLWLRYPPSYASSKQQSDENDSTTPLFILFVHAVADSLDRQVSAWLAAWFWRRLLKSFPDWLKEECGERLGADTPEIEYLDDGLLGDYQKQLDDALEPCSSYVYWQDAELAQLAIKSACETRGPEFNRFRDLLVEAFADNRVLGYLLPSEYRRDYCLVKQLNALENLIVNFSQPLQLDDEQLMDELYSALIQESATGFFETFHPVSQIWYAATRSWFEDDPSAIERWLAYRGERITKESLVDIMSAYSSAQFPRVADYVAAYVDANNNLKPVSSACSVSKFDSGDKDKPETVDLGTSWTSDIAEEYQEFCQALEGKTGEETYAWVTSGEQTVHHHVAYFGHLIRQSMDVRQGKTPMFSDVSKISDAHFQALISAYTSETFEREVSQTAAGIYPTYVAFCKPHLNAEQYLLRIDKCLGKLRPRLRSYDPDLRIGEYAGVFAGLADASEFGKLLKGFIGAFKAAESCGTDDAVRVHWGLKAWAVQWQKNYDIALNWYMAKWLPEQVMSVEHEDSGNWSADALEAYKVEKLQILVEVLSEFCVSSLQLRKGQKAKDGGYYPKQCKEPDAHWRRAMLRALAELRLDVGGEAHEVAYFVHKHDFDTETREIAKEVHRDLRLFKPYKNSRDLHRAYLAALWQLRMGKAYAADVDIDLDLAKRWKTRELQRVK